MHRATDVCVRESARETCLCAREQEMRGLVRHVSRETCPCARDVGVRGSARCVLRDWSVCETCLCVRDMSHEHTDRQTCLTSTQTERHVLHTDKSLEIHLALSRTQICRETCLTSTQTCLSRHMSVCETSLAHRQDTSHETRLERLVRDSIRALYIMKRDTSSKEPCMS